jgi:hypothetical protein
MGRGQSKAKGKREYRREKQYSDSQPNIQATSTPFIGIRRARHPRCQHSMVQRGPLSDDGGCHRPRIARKQLADVGLRSHLPPADPCRVVDPAAAAMLGRGARDAMWAFIRPSTREPILHHQASTGPVSGHALLPSVWPAGRPGCSRQSCREAGRGWWLV